MRSAAGVLLGLAIAWVGTASGYWSGASASDWPWSLPALITGLITSVAAVLIYPYKQVAGRVVATFFALALLLPAFLFLGLFTACSYGDCL
ncbi:hypothetical protein [Agrilutibacter solisilvae]|uniref:Uncharacterized protein n=1 Tax=Agrilutibacter solisilvae TaxID=2763317 RepID=A0A974XY67_9GAMM|nr:hypothetical protein [Lysobacter solisilvae]QSX77967.1 hypothetical protein I8J32_014765 [Lysobacter solisilvae]